MINVHSRKLTDIIDGMVDELSVGSHLNETIKIGDFEGMQIHITTTKEEDDFIEADGLICVNRPTEK
jgi:hypothetical protein